MLGSWPFQMRCPGVKQEISAVYHGTLHSNHLSCMLPPFCSESLIITLYYYLLLLLLLLIILSESTSYLNDYFFRWLNRNHYHGSISCWPLFQFNATVGLGFKCFCFSISEGDPFEEENCY